MFDVLAKLSAPAEDYVELGVESKAFNGTMFHVVLTLGNKGIALESEQARIVADCLNDMAEAADAGMARSCEFVDPDD